MIRDHLVVLGPKLSSMYSYSNEYTSSFPGLWPRIWPHLLRLVTNGNVGQAPLGNSGTDTTVRNLQKQSYVSDGEQPRATVHKITRIVAADWQGPGSHDRAYFTLEKSATIRASLPS